MRVLVAAVLAVVLAVGAGGRVAGATPAAKEAYSRGIALYQAARYAEAADAFLAAYAAQPKPMILYNVGQAHRKDGKFPLALQFYQRFLQEASPAERHAVGEDTERYIAEIEAHLALERSLLERSQRDRDEAARLERELKSRPAVAPRPEPRPEPRPAEVVLPVVPAPAVTAEVAVAKPAAPKKKTPLHKTWWLWTAVGVVAAGVAIGVGVGVAQTQPPGTALGTRMPAY